MSGPDPRWLELLKANGWQTTALAAACGTVLFLVKKGYVQTDGSPYWVLGAVIGAVVFGCLSLAAIGRAVVQATDVGGVARRWWLRRLQRKAARDYIPFMTAKERSIVAYLLHHNQRVFQTTQDGGYAAPLIAQGVVWPAVAPGQVVSAYGVPFEIPEHIWSTLKKHRDAFPYDPGGDGGPPWNIHWMAR